MPEAAPDTLTPDHLAHRVRSGKVCVVGPHDTGLREVATLLHHYGAGVSRVITTHHGDLGEGGDASETLAALERAEADPDTEVIALLGRLPTAASAERVIARAVATGRRVAVALLGYTSDARPAGFALVSTFEDAARAAAMMAGAGMTSDHPTLRVTIPRFTREQRWLRALYAGTALACEALEMLTPMLKVATNVRFPGALQPGERAAPVHTLVDFGDAPRGDALADLTARVEAMRLVGGDPAASVLLLDVVLGEGAHADPASVLVPELRAAREAAAARGGTLVVVCSVTGTDADAQVRGRQVEALIAAGAEVCSSNAAAVRRARAIVTGEWP